MAKKKTATKRRSAKPLSKKPSRIGKRGKCVITPPKKRGRPRKKVPLSEPKRLVKATIKDLSAAKKDFEKSVKPVSKPVVIPPVELEFMLAWRNGENFSYGKKGVVKDGILTRFGHSHDAGFNDNIVPLQENQLQEGDVIWEAPSLKAYFQAVNAGETFNFVKKNLSDIGKWRIFKKGKLEFFTPSFIKLRMMEQVS